MNNNRSILVTGCSSGIGHCVAAGLRKRGYRVFAAARKPADVDGLIRSGLEAVQLDVANSASVESALNEVLERSGGSLYGLFNSAGYGQPGAVEDLSREVLRDQFETNLFGLHDLTCRVIPVMRRQGEGRIIMNSSVLGLVALKYRGAYCASKFALEGLTDALRMELEGSGIRVSLIEPGPVVSEFRKNAYAMFRRNIDPEPSFHRQVYRAVERRLSAEDNSEVPFTLGPEAVLDKVVHALESRRPRIRYYVTLPTYGFAFLRRVLPQWLMNRVLIGASNEEYRHYRRS